jgi:iron complex transport system substrate-binding protein
MRQFPPARIVCLTEETVETLYLLGEEHRIVGVSGYAVRPARVRREKPRVSAFTSANVPKILALDPDLVLTFSDLQASIAAELIRAGVAVHAFNQRDVAGILAMIRTLGALVGAGDKAERLVRSYEARLADVAASSRRRARQRVYFEEWDDPLISGIGWVSELIEIAGGDDVFARLSLERANLRRSGSSLPRQSSQQRPMSCSPRGAARKSLAIRSAAGPVGMLSQRCETAA